MLIFVLGFISGILLMGFFSVIVLGTEIRRVTKETVRALHNEVSRVKDKLSPTPVEILEPTSPEVEAVELVVEENKKRGRDTEIVEL